MPIRNPDLSGFCFLQNRRPKGGSFLSLETCAPPPYRRIKAATQPFESLLEPLHVRILSVDAQGFSPHQRTISDLTRPSAAVAAAPHARPPLCKRSALARYAPLRRGIPRKLTAPCSPSASPTNEPFPPVTGGAKCTARRKKALPLSLLSPRDHTHDPPNPTRRSLASFPQ